MKNDEQIPYHYIYQSSLLLMSKGQPLRVKYLLGAGLSSCQRNYLWWQNRCPK